MEPHQYKMAMIDFQDQLRTLQKTRTPIMIAHQTRDYLTYEQDITIGILKRSPKIIVPKELYGEDQHAKNQAKIVLPYAIAYRHQTAAEKAWTDSIDSRTLGWEHLDMNKFQTFVQFSYVPVPGVPSNSTPRQGTLIRHGETGIRDYLERRMDCHPEFAPIGKKGLELLKTISKLR